MSAQSSAPGGQAKPALRIGVFAFADSTIFFREVIELARARGEAIDWSIVVPQGSYISVVRDLVDSDHFLYLYRDFNREFARATGEPGLSASRDNINLILEADKDAYRHESGKFQYRWAEVAIAIYRAFLKKTRPHYMLFPCVESVEGVLLMNLCHEMGIRVVNSVHMRSLGTSFFSETQYETLPPYFGHCTDEDRAQAEKLLTTIESGLPNPVGLPELDHLDDSVEFRPPHFVLRFFRALVLSLGPERHYRAEGGWMLRITSNMHKPLNALRRLRFRLLDRPLFDITSDRPGLCNRFVLYAAQMTPEQSINSVAQYYVAQERVIDLLRLYLPHGYRLVVKEHPIMVGRRARSFYKNLRRKAGVLMASPEVSTPDLIRKSAFVASVTGTIGLECYFMDKPCLLFGRNFFKHLCFGADPVEGLKDKMQRMLDDYHPPARPEKIESLGRLYNIGYPFVLYGVFNLPTTVERANIRNYLDALLSHIGRLRAMGDHAARPPGMSAE